MQINQLNSFFPNISTINGPAKDAVVDNVIEEKNFGELLKKSIQALNEQQIQSDKATSMFAEGQKIDLHEVMIAGQKASISMQAALEIRNKAVEAYQEIMRMQV